MNCWEFRHCPEKTIALCPAYPNKGRDCWKITGTKCNLGQLEKATLGEKIEYCRSCDFYKAYANKF